MPDVTCPRCHQEVGVEDLTKGGVYWDKPFKGEQFSRVCWLCVAELKVVGSGRAPIYVKVTSR